MIKMTTAQSGELDKALKEMDLLISELTKKSESCREFVKTNGLCDCLSGGMGEILIYTEFRVKRLEYLRAEYQDQLDRSYPISFADSMQYLEEMIRSEEGIMGHPSWIVHSANPFDSIIAGQKAKAALFHLKYLRELKARLAGVSSVYEEGPESERA